MLNKRSLTSLSCLLLIVGSELTLAQVPSEKKASPSQWHIKPRGENLTEILGPGAIYVVESSAKGVSIEARRDARTVETNSFERKGPDEYVLTASTGAGRMNLTIKTTQDKVSTDVELPSEHFTVESGPMEHGLKLAKELKSHDYPKTPYITQLVTELRNNGEFCEEFSRTTRFARVIGGEPDGALVVCVAVCAACAAEFAPACPACILCLMNEGAVRFRPR